MDELISRQAAIDTVFDIMCAHCPAYDDNLGREYAEENGEYPTCDGCLTKHLLQKLCKLTPERQNEAV